MRVAGALALLVLLGACAPTAHDPLARPPNNPATSPSRVPSTSVSLPAPTPPPGTPASTLPSLAPTSTPSSTTAPAPPSTPPAVLARVAVSALPTLPPNLLAPLPAYRVRRVSEHLDVVVPQFQRMPVLNTRLRRVADQTILSFRSTVTSQADHPGRYHSLAVGWQLVAQSPQSDGIQLWVAAQHGGRLTIDRTTVWYDTATDHAVPLSGLFTATAWPAVQHAVETTLAHTHPAARVRAALAARGAPEGAGPSFGFSATGDLVLTFAGDSLATGAGAKAPVSVRLDGNRLALRFSSAGTSARAAALGHRAPTRAKPNCARLKCIALTFDDGPGPYTAELQAVLQQRRVRSTFFLVGDRVTLTPDLVAQGVAGGQEIGNHSSHHLDLTHLSRVHMASDLSATSRSIAAVTGRPPTLLRPPYGARNSSVDAVAAQLKMAEVLWDVDTLDWRYRDAVHNRQAAVTPARRGSIILMHDIHRPSVDSVPGIIADLQHRGFTLVTVSELLGAPPVAGHRYSHQPGTGSR